MNYYNPGGTYYGLNADGPYAPPTQRYFPPAAMEYPIPVYTPQYYAKPSRRRDIFKNQFKHNSSIFCSICQVSCNGQQSWQEHVCGKKHLSLAGKAYGALQSPQVQPQVQAQPQPVLHQVPVHSVQPQAQPTSLFPAQHTNHHTTSAPQAPITQLQPVQQPQPEPQSQARKSRGHSFGHSFGHRAAGSHHFSLHNNVHAPAPTAEPYFNPPPPPPPPPAPTSSSHTSSHSHQPITSTSTSNHTTTTTTSSSQRHSSPEDKHSHGRKRSESKTSSSSSSTSPSKNNDSHHSITTTSKSSSPTESASRFSCDLCNFQGADHHALELHFAGKKHKSTTHHQSTTSLQSPHGRSRSSSKSSRSSQSRKDSGGTKDDQLLKAKLESLSASVDDTDTLGQFVKDIATKLGSLVVRSPDGAGGPMTPAVEDLSSSSSSSEAEPSSIDIGIVGIKLVGPYARKTILKTDVRADIVIITEEPPTISVIGEVHKLLRSVMPEETDVSLQNTTAISIRSHSSYSARISFTWQGAMKVNKLSDGSYALKGAESALEGVDVRSCQEALLLTQQIVWFNENCNNPNLRSSIKIIKDLRNRNPEFAPLTDWMVEVIAVIALRGLPATAALSQSVRAVFGFMASGLLLPGVILLDPCSKEPQSVLRTLTREEQLLITSTAQKFLNEIAFGKWQNVM